MGNNLSSPSILPLTFGECFINGKLNIMKYQLYLLVKRKREENLDIRINCSDSVNMHEEERPKKMRKTRSVKKHQIKISNPDGTFTYMEPRTSLWQMLYVNREPQSKKEKKLCRKRFRLSYNAY